MRVQCPECDAKLRVTLPDDDSRIKCPKCGTKFRPEDDEDEEDEEDEEEESPRSRGKRSGKKGKAKKFPVFEVAGGVLAALFAVGAVIWVVTSRPTKPATQQVASSAPANPTVQPGVPIPTGTHPALTTPTTTPQSSPKIETATNNGGIVTNIPPGEPTPIHAELFRRPVDSQPPKLRAALLTPAADAPPLDVPTFFSLKPSRKTAKTTTTVPKAAKLTLQEIKQATTYIKVDAGDLSGSGSGFIIGASDGKAYIATNHHVIEAYLSKTEGSVAPKITVVFNSGVTGAEQSLEAEVLAIDPIADLAVLRVAAPHKIPKFIDPWATPPLEETMKVLICGFPYGEQLATGGGNPNISVNDGSISSLRLDKGGKLEKVQINGALNPGNSGGPIVDKDGRLVGIAVQTIKGSGIGFAVPVDDLIALLEGKLLVTAFLPTGLEDGKAKFQVVIPVMDPLSHVKTVYVRYWTGLGARPKGVKDPKIGWKPIQPAEQLNLEVPQTPSSLSIAFGELQVPQNADEVVLQIATENMEGMLAASPPVSHKLDKKDIFTGSDAKPFADLTNHADTLAGQTIVVRGKVLQPPASRADVQELVIADTGGNRSSKLRFLTSREMAAEFDEVVPDDQTKVVRVACLVGTRGDDGVIPVRVARVDFLSGRGDRIVRSIPGTETKDPLASLNRNPASYAGQTLDLKAAAVPMTPRTGTGNEFLVLFPHFSRPRNLAFVTAPGLAEKIVDEKLTKNAIYRVRLVAKVGDVPPRSSAPVTVTVRKIEILDTRNDTVIKTIE